MASHVVYGSDFDREFTNGNLALERFTYRFLVEGDSWMDRSSPLQSSLPWALADRFDEAGESALFINLAQFGDTMRRMGETAGGEFAGWVQRGFHWPFDAILLSAAGNDFIDAARDPAAGQGILAQIAPGAAAAASVDDCLRNDAIQLLVDSYLNPNFAVLHNMVRTSQDQSDVPLFLNCYDVPTARRAGVVRNRDAWLYAAYTKNGTPEGLWPGVTQRIFGAVSDTVAGWARQRDGVFTVPTVGSLDPAQPKATGSSGDWLNEIHLNKSGWKKLARVWFDRLYPVVKK